MKGNKIDIFSKTRIFTLTLLFILSCSAYAQVGINTDTPEALLDITVDDPDNPIVKDGILIPRVNNLNYTPGAAQEGLLTYLTTMQVYSSVDGAGNPITCTRYPGFYYWDNESGNEGWEPVKTKLAAFDSGLVLYHKDCRYTTIADAFSGSLQTGLWMTYTSNMWQKFIVVNEVIDNYNSYDNTTGVFTCRESGTYRVNITLDLQATVTDFCSFIFGLVKLAPGNDGTEIPSPSGNLYVTRNTAVFNSSVPQYANPYTISSYVQLEAGERYVFGGLTTQLGAGEQVILKATNAGSTGAGQSSIFSIDRIK